MSSVEKIGEVWLVTVQEPGPLHQISLLVLYVIAAHFPIPTYAKRINGKRGRNLSKLTFIYILLNLANEC